MSLNTVVSVFVALFPIALALFAVESLCRELWQKLFPPKANEDLFEVQWAIAHNEERRFEDGLWEDEFMGRPLTVQQREQLTRWLEASTAKAIAHYVDSRTRQRKR